MHVRQAGMHVRQAGMHVRQAGMHVRQAGMCGMHACMHGLVKSCQVTYSLASSLFSLAQKVLKLLIKKISLDLLSRLLNQKKLVSAPLLSTQSKGVFIKNYNRQRTNLFFVQHRPSIDFTFFQRSFAYEDYFIAFKFSKFLAPINNHYKCNQFATYESSHAHSKCFSLYFQRSSTTSVFFKTPEGDCLHFFMSFYLRLPSILTQIWQIATFGDPAGVKGLRTFHCHGYGLCETQ